MPNKPAVDAFVDRASFVQGVVDWRTKRVKSKQTNRMGPVCNAIRDAEDVFPGVGVYTISELCFIAGSSLRGVHIILVTDGSIGSRLLPLLDRDGGLG